MGLTDFSFTPSEFILLNGNRFSPEGKGKDALTLLCSEGSVNGPHLAAMCLIAAILANKEEGALTIEEKRAAKLFGSRSDSRITLRPGGIPPKWNGYTLESAILFTSGQLFSTQGNNSVQNITSNLIITATRSPWEKIIEIVEWGLASSNWLLPVEGEAATAFQTPFICPEKVRELAFMQPIGPIQSLLEECKETTPEIWKQMLAEIKQAFKA